MFDDVPGVLFFAAGPARPAGSRGNDYTWEEAAGKTRRAQLQWRYQSDGVSIVSHATGLRGGRFSPAPPLLRAARHSNKGPVFPGLGSKYRFPKVGGRQKNASKDNQENYLQGKIITNVISTRD